MSMYGGTGDWNERPDYLSNKYGINQSPQGDLLDDFFRPFTLKGYQQRIGSSATGAGATGTGKTGGFGRGAINRNITGTGKGGGAGSDPYLDLLRSLAFSGGSRPDLSGYNRQLNFLSKEKQRMKERYKKYSAAISDIYGTLTGITQKMIADIAPSTEMQSAQMAAMEAQQAAATRATENERLGTATEARANLGLEELAGEYAGGDVVTQESEGRIADEQALSAAAQNTLASNRAIAEQAGQNQILGYGLAQEQSQLQLAKSLEDALAAIRAEQVAVRNQKAAAKASATPGGPNLGVLKMIQDYTNPKAPGEPTQLEEFQIKYPSLKITSQKAVDTFTDWVTSNWQTIPSVKMGDKPLPLEILNTFKDQVPEAASWLNNNTIYTLLLGMASGK